MDHEPGAAGPDTDQKRAEQDLVRLRDTYGDCDARALLEAMIKTEFAGRIALVSSFGAESAVLLDLVAEVDPATPVVFLDTHKLFGETLRYRDQLQKRLGLTNILTIEPDPAEVEREDHNGLLWTRDVDACCGLRKVRPLARALEGFDAWITGRKRFQGATRAGIPLIERSGSKFKINPLATWRPEDINAYMKQRDLPPHPLVKDGFLSIGCMPCTRPVRPGESARDGRWAGLDKTECGIHVAENI
ncbi:MAG: phosphoadenylyl-sulfate reductase [Alphaproteobacteria bacterium]|nr:MAG: phosphoadenylyl-sulfate reductase [Alphaproteobacteria bacterium]